MLAPGTRIAGKTNKGWVVAVISDKLKLTKKKSLTKLADVKDEGFITLASYLKTTKSPDEPQAILEALDCTSLYVQYEEAVNPDSRGTKAWEKMWWKDKNAYCMGCKGRCKQSSHVDILSCNTFEKV